MKRGYINICENENNEFTVEVELAEGTLWLSIWEMASLFNVYTRTIQEGLKAIFKAGLLKEDDVCKTHTCVHKGHDNYQMLYNLSALVFVGFRIGSCEAKAFQNWVLKVFSENIISDKTKASEVPIVLRNNFKVPIILSLN